MHFLIKKTELFAVEIKRCEVSVLNGKTEWRQPPLWQIQNEILQGIVSECGTAQFVMTIEHLKAMDS